MRRLTSLFVATLIVLLAFITVSFAQDSLNVRRLARLGAYGWDVGISGNRAYVCEAQEGLMLVDISQLDTLIDLGTFYPPC